MYSGADLHKGGVSPFGHPRINDRSHLPAAFRSVPRPSSPLGAKASTERPSFTQLLPPPARRTNTTQNLRPRSNQHPRVQPDGSNTENNSTQPQITTNTTNTPESMPAHQQPPGLLNTPFRFTCQRSRETTTPGIPGWRPSTALKYSAPVLFGSTRLHGQATACHASGTSRSAETSGTKFQNIPEPTSRMESGALKQS